MEVNPGGRVSFAPPYKRRTAMLDFENGLFLLLACIGCVMGFAGIGAALEWAAQHPGGF